MKKYVFRIGVEVEPMEGTQLPDDCYRPVHTYEAYALDLDETGFDTDKEGYTGNQDIQAIKKEGGIGYGPLHIARKNALFDKKSNTSIYLASCLIV